MQYRPRGIDTSQYFVKLSALPMVQFLYPQHKLKTGPLWAWGYLPKDVARIIINSDPGAGTPAAKICRLP